MTQVAFDAATAARIEAAYLAGDAARRRRIVREALQAAAGERVLDVGCGPGFYCAEIAGDVGPSGSVVGVDSSPAMLELAARRCAAVGNPELQEERRPLVAAAEEPRLEPRAGGLSLAGADQRLDEIELRQVVDVTGACFDEERVGLAMHRALADPDGASDE